MSAPNPAAHILALEGPALYRHLAGVLDEAADDEADGGRFAAQYVDVAVTVICAFVDQDVHLDCDPAERPVLEAALGRWWARQTAETRRVALAAAAASELAHGSSRTAVAIEGWAALFLPASPTLAAFPRR